MMMIIFINITTVIIIEMSYFIFVTYSKVLVHDLEKI